MSSKNVNSFSTIDTVNTYSNSSLLGIVSGNLTRLTSGNLVLNQVNASNLIYNTGNQTISGIKTFATGINISGHVGIGINSTTFDLYVRKSPAGVTVNPDSNSIAVFEGSGNSHITILAPNSASAGVVLGSPADTFGSYLTWNHDNNALKLSTAKTNGFIQLLTNNEAEAVRITSAGNVGIGTNNPSEKLTVNGNILGDNLVYNTGNQTIFGNKSFYGNTIINNLTVTGTETIVNTSVLNVANPYILLNISGGVTDGGIFFVTGVGLTGINDTGPIIGFDHSNKFKFGISTRNSDHSSLPDIASVQQIEAYSGVADNKFATITNLVSTGSTLNTKINNLSGVSVLTFGNQTISGVKTFATRPTVNGTGVLLSGQNTFHITFTHGQMDMNNNSYYFSTLQSLTAAQITTRRRITMMQNCQARYACWSTFTLFAREQDSTTNPSTGYFVNNTTNESGIITTQLRHAGNGTLATFTGEITPPIDINFGDQVQLVLNVPNYTIGMSGVNNAVDVTFYN
jgi:hypothetical protein